MTCLYRGGVVVEAACGGWSAFRGLLEGKLPSGWLGQFRSKEEAERAIDLDIRQKIVYKPEKGFLLDQPSPRIKEKTPFLAALERKQTPTVLLPQNVVLLRDRK